MKNKNLYAGAVLALGMAVGVQAETITASYGWEDGGSILGSYGNLGGAEQTFGQANSGTSSLYLWEDPMGGTPQAYAAHITGLSDGDNVYTSFMALGGYDFGLAKVRIWAHYASSDDITDYNGSAGGGNNNSGYAESGVWEEVSSDWTFDSDGGERDSLVIEIRLYSSAAGGFEAFVDDLFVSVTGDDLSGVSIVTPLIPAPGALALLGLAGMTARPRRRH